jgi:hypothetical protein
MRDKFKTQPIDFNKGFTQAVSDGAKVWEDRQSTVGASEAFGCHRKIFFKRMAPELADVVEEIDPEWGHTERGNLIENEFVVPKLASMFGAERCLYMGSSQKTFKDGRLSATPDGIVIDLPRDALILYGVDDIGGTDIATEVKTFGGTFAEPKKYITRDADDNPVVRYQARAQHVGQNIIQMGCIAKNTNYQPKTGVVLYVNPVNLKDIRVATVVYDHDVYTNALRRAEEIYIPGKQASDFRAEGLRGGNDCTYCEFTRACLSIEHQSMPSGKKKDIDSKRLAELELLTKNVFSLRAKYTDLGKTKKAAEADLRAALFSAGTTHANGGDWSASVSKRPGRKSLSKDMLIDDGVDVENYMKQGEDYFVLNTKSE